VERFRGVNFANQATGRVYLKVVCGKPTWADPEALAQAVSNPDTRTGLSHTVPAALDRSWPRPDRRWEVSETLGGRPLHTLGRWGASQG
jgi:hypothetical protein